jgi:hypothetical protein
MMGLEILTPFASLLLQHQASFYAKAKIAPTKVHLLATEVRLRRVCLCRPHLRFDLHVVGFEDFRHGFERA